VPTGYWIATLTIVLLLCIDTSAGDVTSADSTAQQLRDLRLVDINARVHTPFREESTVAVALIFVSTDCPVANAFQPVLKQISDTYKSQGIRCFMIHSSAKATNSTITRHINDYEIELPVVHDSDQSIGRMVDAKVTPEAIVIDRSGEVRYRGLINNLYAGYGKKRQRATQHYLTDALDALMSGAPVRTAITKPVGCFIHYEGSDKE